MPSLCGILTAGATVAIEPDIARMLGAHPPGTTGNRGVIRQGPAAFGWALDGSDPGAVDAVCPAVSSGDFLFAGLGRLDNREEVADELDIPRPIRGGLSDPGLMARACAKWGVDCAGKLLGDWYFACWDGSRRELSLVRDHQGHVALYYYTAGGLFVFASTLRALLNLSLIPQRPNDMPLAQVLCGWADGGAETCYRDVYQLPPAHRLTHSVDTGATRTEQYWNPAAVPRILLKGNDDDIDAFRNLFRDAVRPRLPQGIPSGALLSGGLDSGLVVSFAAETLHNRGETLVAYTSVPESQVDSTLARHRITDERELAGETAARHGNVRSELVDAAAISPSAGLRSGLDILHEPVCAASNLYWILAILERARRDGVRLLLTGQGGNFTVSWDQGGGVLDSARLGNFRQLWRTLRSRDEQSLAHAVWHHIVLPALPAAARDTYLRLRGTGLIDFRKTPIALEFAQSARIGARFRQSGYDPHVAFARDSVAARLALLRPGRTTTGAFWHNLGGAFGISVCDPTIDKRIIEFCLSCPDDMFHRDGITRYLARRAGQGLLPERVLTNTRRGLQSADLVHRLRSDLVGLQQCLDELSKSELAGQYVNLNQLQSIVLRLADDQPSDRTSREFYRLCTNNLMRGMMVGLFLARIG